jgi:alkylation response protein AidB-like acyl-CoA dehydrogenase
LEQQAADHLFSGDRRPVIAGQGTKPGTAVARDKGFLLSGSWSFASGIKSATHIHTLAIIGGSGEARIFVLPVQQAELIENWDVLGLRGTGSIDYRIDQVFVPESYTHSATTASPKRGGSLYTIGIIGFAEICHAGWACGVGRRLLDELVAKVRTGIGRAGALAESDAFHEKYARAEATYRSARAFVIETWSAVTASLQRGDQLSVRDHTMIRLALTHLTWSCHEVAEFVYHAAGTVALRSGTIQRLFRDVHAGTQHITAAPGVIRAAGRELAGCAPNKHWVFLDLAGGT